MGVSARPFEPVEYSCTFSRLVPLPGPVQLKTRRARPTTLNGGVANVERYLYQAGL